MSVLRNLEAKLEGLVEGAFSRAFKSRVQPVELARKLAKEMEENKTISVSRVYVPNEYRIFLSPDDRAQFEGYEPGLKKELSDYLLEHARNEGLALITRPSIEFQNQILCIKFSAGTLILPTEHDENPVSITSRPLPSG